MGGYRVWKWVHNKGVRVQVGVISTTSAAHPPDLRVPVRPRGQEETEALLVAVLRGQVDREQAVLVISRGKRIHDGAEECGGGHR